MPVPPIEPTFLAEGPEWQVGGIAPAGEVDGSVTGAGGGKGFGDMLAGQIDQLQDVQSQGADAARSLADGTATDVASVTMSIERARLAMQLASQVRTKAVESFQDIFHTQV